MKQVLGKVLMICMVLSLFLCGHHALKAEAAGSTVTEQLNFLVVESSYLEASEEQKVAVSVGNGESTITAAVLHYTNRDTGEAYEEPAEKIIDDAILFVMKPEEKGIYELNRISYTADGVSYEIELSQLKRDVLFGVNKEVEDNAYQEIEVQGTGEEVVVVDAQGEQISEVSIAEALENAKNDRKVWARASQRSNGKFVVALDPGHGGSDPGVVRIINGVTYSERDLVLKIANFCKEELQKNGIEVCLTRTDNGSKLMNRKERTDYAVSKGASIIVSLHLNSTEATMGSASGSLVIVPDDNTESGELSQELAVEILKKLELLGLNNRGTTVDEELGMVLYPKQYGIPGIIVEHAFLNNKNDALNYLSSDAKLKKLGIADAQGIMAYMKNNFISFGNSTVYDGRDYKDVFNAEFYADRYSDLKNTYGTNVQKLLKHFVLYGRKEGRQGSEEFDPKAYRARYSDLAKAYGDDLEKYYWHYMVAGKAEGRNGKTLLESEKPEEPDSGLTVYDGRDYKDVFNAAYYMNRYGDLKNVYGTNAEKLLKHFVLYGRKEGRCASEEFDPKAYRARYGDLNKAYGDNMEKYYWHYMVAGKAEGRNGKQSQ